MRWVRKRVDVFVTQNWACRFSIAASGTKCHARVAGQNHWSTLRANMPPAHSAVAKRTPDWVRGHAAKVGVAISAYVERLLTGRDHIEWKVCDPAFGILRLATCYLSEQLEAACVRAMSAGASSSALLSTCSRASTTRRPRGR